MSAEESWERLFVVYNASDNGVELSLPAGDWTVLADGMEADCRKQPEYREEPENRRQADQGEEPESWRQADCGEEPERGITRILAVPAHSGMILAK